MKFSIKRSTFPENYDYSVKGWGLPDTIMNRDGGRIDFSAPLSSFDNKEVQVYMDGLDQVTYYFRKFYPMVEVHEHMNEETLESVMEISYAGEISPRQNQESLIKFVLYEKDPDSVDLFTQKSFSTDSTYSKVSRDAFYDAYNGLTDDEVKQHIVVQHSSIENYIPLTKIWDYISIENLHAYNKDECPVYDAEKIADFLTSLFPLTPFYTKVVESDGMFFCDFYCHVHMFSMHKNINIAIKEGVNEEEDYRTSREHLTRQITTLSRKDLIDENADVAEITGLKGSVLNHATPFNMYHRYNSTTKVTTFYPAEIFGFSKGWTNDITREDGGDIFSWTKGYLPQGSGRSYDAPFTRGFRFMDEEYEAQVINGLVRLPWLPGDGYVEEDYKVETENHMPELTSTLVGTDGHAGVYMVHTGKIEAISLESARGNKISYKKDGKWVSFTELDKTWIMGNKVAPFREDWTQDVVKVYRSKADNSILNASALPSNGTGDAVIGSLSDKDKASWSLQDTHDLASYLSDSSRNDGDYGVFYNSRMFKITLETVDSLPVPAGTEPGEIGNSHQNGSGNASDSDFEDEWWYMVTATLKVRRLKGDPHAGK